VVRHVVVRPAPALDFAVDARPVRVVRPPRARDPEFTFEG
jgi:hypothetical protein